MQSAYALWGASYAIMRVGVQEWVARREQHLQAAIRDLSRTVEIVDPQERADAITQVMRGQVQSTFDDWAAAGFRAMTYAGAQMNRQREEAARGQAEWMRNAAGVPPSGPMPGGPMQGGPMPGGPMPGGPMPMGPMPGGMAVVMPEYGGLQPGGDGPDEGSPDAQPDRPQSGRAAPNGRKTRRKGG
jgi:hypothetical protein